MSSRDAGDSTVTAVLTSCGRFELLERALRSFRTHNTAPLARFLLMEDSGDPAVREIAASVDPAIEVEVAPERRGQLASIDAAYARVRTPYIFHMEDDYVFLRGGFIEESIAILEADPRVSMVSARRMADFNGHDVPATCIGGVSARAIPRDIHPGWFGYAFHTGLRRRKDWQRFGPFAPYRREWDVSYAMKRAGMHMVYLADPACYDDDGGISVGAVDPARRRDPVGRKLYALRKSAKKALFEVERRLGRYAD